MQEKISDFLKQNNLCNPTVYKNMYEERYHVLCYDVNNELVVIDVTENLNHVIAWNWERKENNVKKFFNK